MLPFDSAVLSSSQRKEIKGQEAIAQLEAEHFGSIDGSGGTTSREKSTLPLHSEKMRERSLPSETSA